MKKGLFLVVLFFMMISLTYSQKTEISTRVTLSENSGIEHGESSELNLTHQKIISQIDNTQLSSMSKTSMASILKTVNLTSGNLLSLFTSSELTTVSDLIITGTMDARDFKTIRDKMTALATLNLSGVSITAYTGTEGTDTIGKIKSYEADAIPQFALWNSETRITNSLTSIILPQNITLIKRYAFLGQSFSSINIPATVKTIDLGTFYNCKSLTSAKIGSGVESLGDRVFQNCSKLTSVIISSGLEAIGNWSFWNCTNLSAIIVNEGNQKFSSLDGVLFNKDKTILVQFPQAKQTTYSIPSGITTIGVGAFGSVNKLVSLLIPNSVTTIKDWAFEACTGLTTLTIPENIVNIGDATFYGCSNLATVNYNAINCTTMGSRDYPAFYTSGLTTLKISDEVKSIPAWAFGYCTKLSSITFGNNVEIIGQGSFVNCVKITAITIPNSVTVIGNDAFNSCSALTSITIPDNVSEIGGWAFYKCSSLNSVNFNAINCTTMGSLNYPVFYNCSALTLNIGNNVISIPSYAFYNCNSLTCLIIGSGITSIGSDAFSKCSNLTKVNFNAINCRYMGGNSTLMTVFPYCDSLTTLNIGDEVTTIPDYAFCLCVNLSSITIGNNLKSIGKSAFRMCRNITSISIPNSVTVIGEGAFFQADALTSISIGSGVTTIGNLAFYCSSLAEITSLNPIPPTLGETVFEGVPVSTCVLKVPVANIDSYHSADQWKDFTNIVEITTAIYKVNNQGVRIYPNPIIDNFSIAGLEGDIDLILTDLNGKVLMDKQVSMNENVFVSNLPKGIYLIQLINNGSVFYYEKMIKK